jgi:hypothetical protein
VHTNARQGLGRYDDGSHGCVKLIAAVSRGVATMLDQDVPCANKSDVCIVQEPATDLTPDATAGHGGLYPSIEGRSKD